MQNELKRTQIAPQMSAEMCELRAEFESSGASQVLAEASATKDDRRRYRQAGGIPRTAREYENRGNELKKYFKIRDITF